MGVLLRSIHSSKADLENLFGVFSSCSWRTLISLVSDEATGYAQGRSLNNFRCKALDEDKHYLDPDCQKDGTDDSVWI